MPDVLLTYCYSLGVVCIVVVVVKNLCHFVMSPYSVSRYFNSKFINPFPNNKFWTFPNLKESADNNFKLDENGRKFSKRVENTV